MSAAELFGAPPPSSTEEEANAASGQTLPSELVEQQSPVSTESTKNAVELFGAAANDPAAEAEVVADDPVTAEDVVADTGEPVKEETDTVVPVPAVEPDAAVPAEEESELEIVVLAEPEAVGLDEAPGAAHIDDAPNAESPSKLMDDESEMLQEVCLSPTKELE